MATWKQRRLIEAVQRFTAFGLFVDLVSLTLFVYIAIGTGNKVFHHKIVSIDFFEPSWRTLAVCAFVFVMMASTRIYNGREFSAFEREAILKSARKNNSRP